MRYKFKYLLAWVGLSMLSIPVLEAQSKITKKYLCKGVWELTGYSFDYTNCISFDLPDEVISGKYEDEKYHSALDFNAETDSVKNLITGLTKPFSFITTNYGQYLMIGDEPFRAYRSSRKEIMIAPYSFQSSISGVGYYFKRKKKGIWKRLFGKNS